MTADVVVVGEPEPDVIHGTDDLTVSIDTSRRLADDRPDLVELVEVPGAEHVQSWNIDRATYERSVVEFLELVAD